MSVSISEMRMFPDVTIGDRDVSVMGKNANRAHSLSDQYLTFNNDHHESFGVHLKKIPLADNINAESMHKELTGFNIAIYHNSALEYLELFNEALMTLGIFYADQIVMNGHISSEMTQHAAQELKSQGVTDLVGGVVNSSFNVVATALKETANSKYNAENKLIAQNNEAINDLNTEIKTELNPEGIAKKQKEIQEYRDSIKAAEKSAAKARRSSVACESVDNIVSKVGSGITNNARSNLAATQKLEEHEAHVAEKTFDLLSHNLQKTLESLAQMQNAVLDILASQKQAADAAASIRC